MFILHLILGFAILGPFLVFGLAHLATSWKRPNRSAVRFGLALLSCALVVGVSGLVLVRLDRFERFEVRDPTVRAVGYWLHVVTPLLAIGLYVKHRLAGPRIRWEWLRVWGGIVAVFVVLMGLLHAQDPRSFAVRGPKQGKQYFYPSEAVTATGKFIPAETLMMDDYCLKCHQDAYKGWFHSAHHFSSFNNKPYLTSVRETRRVSMERDGNTQAARWCAGCHDPVPFFSGAFDDPNYDDVNTKSSQAGITCTVCHSITKVNSTRGNADYTLEEPQHYPFASSESPLLQWVNNTLIKAKPEMHKKTFLKPVIKDSKFCSTCHKVGLPFALNHYKDFLRGQNHYDTFLLSGVSGGGARSFYYPPQAKGQCIDCHMNMIPSLDFGARDFDGKGGREIHNHLFLGANTGLAPSSATRGGEAHSNFSRTKVRVDLFALREETSALPRAEEAVSGRGRRPDARPGASFQPGDGRLERDLGRVDRQSQRPRGRPLGRDRRRREGRPLLPFHQRLHARPRGQSDRPPEPARYFRPPLQQANPPRGGAGRPLRARGPRGHPGADHARGEGQLPEVRSDLPRHHLRQGEGARAPGRRHGPRPRPAPGPRGTEGSERTVPHPRGRHLAALE
ncbi:MAG: multiheme c-type cytochrome [Singulisphaera sp.]